MSAPKAAWVDGLCKTCGQYTHSCKCAHPPTPDFMKSFFAAPQEGAGSTAGPATNGEPAAAASWLDTIPTAADGVTCRIEDVRRAFLENTSARPEALCNDWVKDAARSTNARVWGCTNDAIPDETVLDSPISLHHVTEMLGKIVRGEITGAKAHRWLGWAQAIICVGGGATLDELKAINKAASDALSALSPLAQKQEKP